jgi:hypothetical protein
MPKSTLRVVALALLPGVLCVAAQSVQAQPSAPPFPEPPSGLKAALDGIHKVCNGQVEKLCPGKQGPDAVACMKSNEDNLSSECKQAVSKVRTSRLIDCAAAL